MSRKSTIPIKPIDEDGGQGRNFSDFQSYVYKA